MDNYLCNTKEDFINYRLNIDIPFYSINYSNDFNPIDLYYFLRNSYDNNSNYMLILGDCYYYGVGVEVDKKTSFIFYEMSAMNNNPIAQYYMGVAYYFGDDGIEKDFDKAFDWYKKSAMNGHKKAQYNLGLCYYKAIGTKKDDSMAFEWYKKSAEQGFALAQLNLGYFYDKGICIEEDNEVAFKWYLEAAKQNNIEAQYNVALCYEHGDGIEKNIEKAIEWYSLSASKNHSKSLLNLGLLFDNAECGERNIEKAMQLYSLAANKESDASVLLGTHYFYGDGVAEDKDKAVKCFLDAANMNNYYAQYLLANCYCFGDGVTKNIENAFYWYNLSAQHGYANAQYSLGYMYYSGEGVDKDYKTALVWLKKAFDNGYTQCKDLIREIDGLIKKQNVNQHSENIDVYFSWSHHNETDMLDAEAELKKAGYSVWQSNSKAIGDLDEAVKEGIRKAKGYIIFLSHDAFSSSYIPKEIDMIFDVLKEKGISNPINIKLYVLGDDTHSVDDVIAELKAQKDKNSFEKLINLAIDFNKKENQLSSLLEFTKIVVKDALFREYRDNQKESYDIFPVTLSDVINQQNDETIIASLTFEKGYINRDLVGNEKKYSVDDILNYENKPILIYGAGGTGKSLYLKNLIRTNLDNNKLFFYLPCSIIKTKIDNTDNLLDVIKCISLKEEKYFHIREDLSSILINDKLDFYIIIDALDEALDKAKLIVDMVINFYKNNRKNNIHIIFTSRNLTDSILIANNNIDSLNLEIKNMDDEDISKLFDNLFERQKIANKTKENNKFSYISKEAFVQTLEILSDDIKKNPLLISNLIYIYFVTNKLYKQKYEIIDKSEELLIKTLENERTIGTDIFDVIHLSAREILTELSYDLCVTNELNVIEQFKEYIKVKNENFDDNQLDDYAKKLYNHLKARKIIAGNSISHEIYRTYFAACYIYDMIYKKCLNRIKVKYIDFYDKEILTEIIDSFLSKDENVWPTVSVDLICKLDYELHILNAKMDEHNLSYETFDKSLKEMLKEDGISKEAYLGLYEVLKKKLLFFYEIIIKYMNRK